MGNLAYGYTANSQTGDGIHGQTDDDVQATYVNDSSSITSSQEQHQQDSQVEDLTSATAAMSVASTHTFSRATSRRMSNRRATLAKKRAEEQKRDGHARSASMAATDELGFIARMLQQEEDGSLSDHSDDNERPRAQSMPLHLDAPTSSTLNDEYDIAVSRVTVGDSAAAKSASVAFGCAATSAVNATKAEDELEADAVYAKRDMLNALLSSKQPSAATDASSARSEKPTGKVAVAMAPSALRLLEKVFHGLPGAAITVGKVRAVLLQYSICRAEQLLAVTSSDLSAMSGMKPSWCKRISGYMRDQRIAQHATNTADPVAKANDELVRALSQRRANISVQLLTENKSRLRRRRPMARATSAPSSSTAGSPAMVGEGSGRTAKDYFVHALGSRRGVLAREAEEEDTEEDEQYYSSSSSSAGDSGDDESDGDESDDEGEGEVDQGGAREGGAGDE
jgi:hypothetical protein